MQSVGQEADDQIHQSLNDVHSHLQNQFPGRLDNVI